MDTFNFGFNIYSFANRFSSRFYSVVGWLEDALLVIVGGLNGIQNGVLEANSSLRTLIKYLKWGLLIIGGIAILIVVLLVVLVFKVVSK